MKALVCGGRDYQDRIRVFWTLGHVEPAITALIEGGARGADTWAREWAIEKGVQYRTFKADWDKYGKAAGFIRNQQMLDEGHPDLVLAFPGGRGTADMVKRAKAGGYRVCEIGET